MNNILLLGANGQLGTDLTKVFQDSADQLLPVFRSDLDMEHPERIRDFLSEKVFDIVINCTSYHKTDECEDFPAKSYMINAIAVAELSKFCYEHNKILFHISTDYVFDGTTDTAYTEADKPLPLSVYGNSKLAGEFHVQAYHDKYFIFRVSSLFGQAGASGKGGNFVETMIRMAKENKPLKVVGDQFMSPTHTLDIARALKAFIDQNVDAYGIYHCSGEGECSWHDFAQEIFSQLGLNPELTAVKTGEFPTRAKRPVKSILDNSKINRFYEMQHWKDALQEYLTLKGYIS